MPVRLTFHRLLLFPLLAFTLQACHDGDSHNDNSDSEVEAQELCFLDDDAVPVQITENNIEYVRTPDACFESLKGYRYSPNYVEIDGLRMHYIDEGPVDGDVVLMLHGQPTWSYLYRKMIPVLVDAGYRVIASDHIGMGRSDKPVDLSIHQYELHVAWTKQFINALELRGITLFVQDWGSLIGLRVAGDMPDRFGRVVIANGDMPVIPPGLNPFRLPDSLDINEELGSFTEFRDNVIPGDRPSVFNQWIEYALTAPNLLPSEVVDLITQDPLEPDVAAAYDAPFPSLIYKAAIRAFPSMIVNVEDQNTTAWNNFGEYEKPFLALAGERDLNLGSEATQNKWINHVPGSAGQPHKRFAAGHFIQEEIGGQLAKHVASFMVANPLTPLDIYAPNDEISLAENIDLRQLDALAGIKLIEGWSYSSRRLEQDLTVNSEGEATVLALPGLSFQRYDAVQ